MTWKIIYYDGKIKDNILNWPAKIKAKYQKILELLIENGVDVGMPFVKPFGSGLFEIRAKGQEGIGRAFFCYITEKRIVILHGFIKKTEQTPNKELDTAKKRLKEVLNHDF